MKNITTYALAFLMLASSWQVWDSLNNKLMVHEGDAKSAICFEGGAEWYDGHCTTNTRPTIQWFRRLQLEGEKKAS